jgi:hypothetical protein
LVKSSFQNQSADLEKVPDTIESSTPSQSGRLTFEQWLQTLLHCPDLLACECRAAKTPRDFEKIKAALHRWQAAGFPRPEEPPEGWKNQVWAYTQKWVDSHTISKPKDNQIKVPTTT